MRNKEPRRVLSRGEGEAEGKGGREDRGGKEDWRAGGGVILMFKG